MSPSKSAATSLASAGSCGSPSPAPAIIEKVVPMFAKSGTKGRAAFIAERGL